MDRLSLERRQAWIYLAVLLGNFVLPNEATRHFFNAINHQRGT